MIVAGSVLALLLMGLAVDGFVNPVDDDMDDTDVDNDTGEAELSDQSGGGNGLTDLLSANDDTADDTPDDVQPAAFVYTPLDEIELDDEVDSDPEEARADEEWAQAASNSGFVDVNETTETADGENIAYVEVFDTETDRLVLEFEGSAEDAPEISVTYDPAEDATFVSANGLPVTLIEGANDMTADHVRVVMSEEPQVLPGATEMADPDAVATELTARATGSEGPQTLSPPAEIEPLAEGLREAGSDEPLTTPTSDITDPTTELLTPRETATEGPLTLPGLEEADPLLPEETTSRDAGLTGPQTTPVTDPLEPVVEPVIETVTDPIEETVDDVVDVVETISDGVPDLGIIDSIMDQVSGDLTSVGGMSEMLEARTGMDDAFGTEGEDAQTGTFNDDLVLGGSGQDALFGDEGNDTLLANDGNDELHGDTGNDVLGGGEGFDFLDGGEGQDTLDGGGDRDLLFGGDGDDVLYGGAANDFLQGGMGADMLNGGSGNDTLDGAFGDTGTDKDDGDILWGGAGDDQIIIGQNDVAHGGDGADTFIGGSYVENTEVAGRVEDFNPGEDRIEVIFDPVENPDPTLEVQDFADGSGADIILNGEVILSVAGAQGLDPNMIELQAMT